MKRKTLPRFLVSAIIALLLLMVSDVDAKRRRRATAKRKAPVAVAQPRTPGMLPEDRWMLLRGFSDEDIINERRRRLMDIYTTAELDAEYDRRRLRTDDDK